MLKNDLIRLIKICVIRPSAVGVGKTLVNGHLNIIIHPIKTIRLIRNSKAVGGKGGTVYGTMVGVPRKIIGIATERPIPNEPVGEGS